VKHVHEQLQKRHGYVLGYTVTKLALHAAGLVRKAPKRSAHRKKSPRRPLPGMLLHQDGSRHGSQLSPDCPSAWQRARSRQGHALTGAQARVLDRSCGRRRRERAGRDGETGFKSNKDTDKQG